MREEAVREAQNAVEIMDRERDRVF